jgi:hypothetical protein
MDYETGACEKTQGTISGELRAKMKAEREYLRSNANVCENSRPFSPEEIVAEFFKYHSPNDVTIPKYAAINQAAKNFAEVILANCPGGADRVDAIRKIREARMTANAAIALNGLSLY